MHTDYLTYKVIEMSLKFATYIMSEKCVLKNKEETMLAYNKDDFDGTLDYIMKSVNDILNKTGKGYETTEEKEKRTIKKNKWRR